MTLHIQTLKRLGWKTEFNIITGMNSLFSPTGERILYSDSPNPNGCFRAAPAADANFAEALLRKMANSGELVTVEIAPNPLSFYAEFTGRGFGERAGTLCEAIEKLFAMEREMNDGNQ